MDIIYKNNIRDVTTFPRIYITAMAPATSASIPPETRLATPALPEGTGADEEEAPEGLDEDSAVEELLLPVAVAMVVMPVIVVMPVAVVMSVMVMLVVVDSEEVVGIAVELGAALDEEAAALRPAMVKCGVKL